MSAPDGTSPPPSGTSSTSSGSGSTSSSWASGKITDGENYRVIRGHKANSKIIVSGDKSYTIEKSTLDKSATNSLEYIYYLRCKDHDCLARAVIKKKVLEVKVSDLRRHTCNERGSGLDKIAVQEALNRMKKRAREEGTTYYVSYIMLHWWSLNNSVQMSHLVYLEGFVNIHLKKLSSYLSC